MAEVKEVFSDNDGWLYSKTVTREFGENRIIKRHDGTLFFCMVQPLVVEPTEHDLVAIGVLV